MKTTKKHYAIFDQKAYYPSLFRILSDGTEHVVHYFTSPQMSNIPREEFVRLYGFTPTNSNALLTEYDAVFYIGEIYFDHDTNLYSQNDLMHLEFSKQRLLAFYRLLNDNKIKAKKICLIDQNDRALPPHTFLDKMGLPYDAILKREYRRSIEKYGYGSYSDKTQPFPFVIFGKKEPVWIYLFEKEQYRQDDIIPKDGCSWGGAWIRHNKTYEPELYCNRSEFLVYHDRFTILGARPQKQFIEAMGYHSMFVHLNGTGHLCKRFYEGLATGRLMLQQKMDVVFPFEQELWFHDATIFETREQFDSQISLFCENKALYQECLDRQNEIERRFLNKEWIREYLESKLFPI